MAAFNGIPSFTWLPPNAAPQAVLLCIHGIGLHGRTFAALGERLARQGVAVYALDVRGFGGWQEAAGAVDLKQSVGDVREAVAVLRREHADLPVFLLGESLGATIAAMAANASEDLIDGLILAAPARVLNHHRSKAAAIFLTALSSGGKSVCITSAVTEYAPHVVAWAEEDPLIRFEYNPLELLQIMRFIMRGYKNLEKLPNIPVMVVQGEGDELITAQSTVELFSQIHSSDKELIVLGGIGHLIFQAQDVAPRTVAIIGDWLAQHSAAVLQPRTDLPLRRAS
ncbi:MAG TPA: alpha/beta fold hydrolase [Candidatus Obscuribacterales bacterium]